MRGSRGVWILLLVVLALALAIYSGLHGRRGADAALKRATQEAAVPTVATLFFVPSVFALLHGRKTAPNAPVLQEANVEP